MDEPIFCPNCGGEMESWHGEIYVCGDCGDMIDAEIFEEQEE